MMSNIKDLKKELRDISFFDWVRSKLFKYPTVLGDTCEYYDQWLSDFLNEGVEVVTNELHTLGLKNKKGVTVEFWVSNYPFAYGNRYDVSPTHPHYYLYPDWELVLKIRKIQLSRRDEIFKAYKDKMSIQK